jgi:hypothetical protein
MRMIIPEEEKPVKPEKAKNRQRIGAIRLQTEMIWSNVPLMSEIFGELRFVPLRTQHILERNEMVMVGLSPRFDEIDCGMESPKRYAIHVEIKSDGTLLKVIVNTEKT